MAVAVIDLHESSANAESVTSLQDSFDLPHPAAPHFHRSQFAPIGTTRVEANKVPQVEHFGMRREANDGDLVRHLVVL
jgi:hypothetical protein